MNKIQNNGTGISVQGEVINNLRFADDIDMIEEDRDILEANVKTIDSEGRKAGLEINVEKTKSMVFGNEALSDPNNV